MPESVARDLYGTGLSVRLQIDSTRTHSPCALRIPPYGSYENPLVKHACRGALYGAGPFNEQRLVHLR